MKTLAIIISLAVATPVLACPDHDSAEAPKTAEKAKATDTKAKEAPKQDAAPATAKKKDEPKTDTTKKADKVSQK